MGVNVFSFFRYYSIGPTMIGFCIYFSAITLFLENVERKPTLKLTKTLLIIGVYTLVSINNHIQEAMFIVLICSIMTAIYVYKFLLIAPIKYGHRKNQTHHKAWVAGLTISIFFCIATLYFHSTPDDNRFYSNDWRLWKLNKLWNTLPEITVLNLTKQFSQALTIWGYLIYFLFFINWQRYRNNIFITAGMISPIFTVLNPYFVDFFLHFAKSPTLWRLSYLIPIHFVAADLILMYYKKLKSYVGVKKIIPLSIIFLVTILLLPFKNTWQGIHYSRFPTLGKTPHQTSYQYYSDVLNFLSTQNKNTVITDVITGYLVASMTHHKSPRRKFFRNYQYNHFSFHEYDENTFDKYQGYLLVINQRPQPISELGKISGHWRANELQSISNYYPEALMTHIKENQSKFEKLWSDNGITVYKIR